MDIAILCGLAFLSTLVAWLYFSYDDLKQEDFSLSKLGTIIALHKKRTVYVCAMFICLCGVAVALELIYPSNTMLGNSKLLVLLGIIFTAAFVDYQKYIIPNKVVLVGLFLRCVIYMVELFVSPDTFFSTLKNDLISFAIVLVFFVICIIFVKSGIGMGDVKLMLLMCLYQGVAGAMSSIFASMLVAFVVSLFLLLTKKKTRKDSIAFAPSILIGTILSVVLTGM